MYSSFYEQKLFSLKKIINYQGVMFFVKCGLPCDIFASNSFRHTSTQLCPHLRLNFFFFLNLRSYHFFIEKPRIKSIYSLERD